MVEISPGRPRRSSVVMSMSSPLRRGKAPFAIRPVLIFGPCRSARMPIDFPRRCAALLPRSMTTPFSAFEPWEKLRRNRSTPALISLSICSGAELAGPSVAMILVLRPRRSIITPSVVESPFALPVGRARGLVALKTPEFLDLPDIEGGTRFVDLRHRLLGSLEWEAVPFIVQKGGAIGHLPVCADGHSMALIATAGWRNGLPGGKHGATARDQGEKHRYCKNKLHFRLLGRCTLGIRTRSPTCIPGTSWSAHTPGQIGTLSP